MTKVQFQVLYREFLFRMVDLELLAPEGDITQLLGQFAAVLITISSLSAIGAIFTDFRHKSPEYILAVTWSAEHSLIAITMLVVGLFAVLSWESTFPDRRDVLVLAPLPLRARTLFLAKVGAVASALGLTVGSLHALGGLLWPFHFIPAGSGLLGPIRTLLAYWITMLASGAFIFCSVLGVQGLAAQLPRRRFLRISSLLQIGAFCVFVSVYFLEPLINTPQALSSPRHAAALAWLPSYWFFGLFHVLNGFTPAGMAPLAKRAAVGLAIAFFGAGTAFLLSYLRTLRKIVEEPDILPGARSSLWMPRFGSALQTAVLWFSVRTLLRSRQHRVILAFYLGVGFAFVTLFTRAGSVHWHRIEPPLIISSFVMMCVAVAGMRVVFAMPLDLRANWIFRITSIRPPAQYLTAIRRPLFVLAVVPLWLAWAGVFFWAWPPREAVQHLVILALWGAFLGYLSLHGFQKIPFTCSYLPGKSRVQLALGVAAGLMLLMGFGTKLELDSLVSPLKYAAMLSVLVILTAAARWFVLSEAQSEEAEVQFEEAPLPTVQLLGLHRDGVVIMERLEATTE